MNSEKSGNLPAVYDEIRAERARQDQQWGGPSHDDNLTIATWLLVIGKHVGRLSEIALDWDNRYIDGNRARTAFQRQLIVVAAVCAAASEAMDRATWTE